MCTNCLLFWKYGILTTLLLLFIDIDECASTPCDKNATCDNTDGSFTCTCNTGYSGDGFDCKGKIELMQYY